MGVISAAISGLIFGFGLILSGMVDPAKVLNFLDVAGAWDPSLAFVMAGAIAVAAPGYWLVRRREKPIADSAFHAPKRADIDLRLVAGSAIFGIGWGLAGLCPGPAVASLALAAPGILPFAAAMLAGIATGAFVVSRWPR